MKRIAAAFLLAALTTGINAQNGLVKRPKLVVGLVVDQMRWDYLYRYADRYGKDGFNRLVSQGFSCENTMIPYTPTYTAAGHSAIYTGSVPAINGIIGNNWYDKSMKSGRYCTQDDDVNTVGSDSKAGKMSPRNLIATTITDELRLATNFNGKVIGIALKDRGAILPAGHSANAAYWYDNAIGGWITSDYYMKALPTWVQAFNARKLVDKYMKLDWNTLYPIETYKESDKDNAPYESNLLGDSNIFPHRTSAISAANRNEAFRTTPFANTFTADFAKSAIEAERLGQHNVTDFLTISFSSPDYIGHAFGPNSIEAEDGYLRLDRELADLLAYLDNKVGKGQYLVFLTADHGAAHVPGFLKEHHIPAGAADDAEIKSYLNKALTEKYNLSNAVITVMNYQVYLDDAVMESAALKSEEVKAFIVAKLKQLPYITTAADLARLSSSTMQETIKTRITNGYNAKLSGDVQFVFNPQWFDGGNKGTTHGLWNPYDSHIPLLWFGWGVKPGKTNRETYMTDIAPTVAAMLRIQMPSGCVGHVIEEVTK